MDRDAFDIIYKNYWLPIYNSAFKRLFDPQKASEITQEAFFQLWLNKEQVNAEEVIIFLLKAVRNEVFKLMKKECIYIVNPPRMLFEHLPLPGAN
ncbi:RNA polymerase sigma factor [Mucilaginibacter mallensis]|uniref:RNA polymerase sigma factor n=1 Tax=Mucilaginibacter mallensis TaxID=652787 RepID=UPI000B82339F|nr:sigma-70 family RNA polymerase sigma factor [Mucilaginibacter mallensis]